MDANGITAAEMTPASRKLQGSDAGELLEAAKTLIVMKGKKVSRWELKSGVPDEARAAMLGPTGNLRAPTIRAGKTLLVGCNEDVYAEVLGG